MKLELEFTIIVIFLFTVASYFSHIYHIFDLICHFRLQYFLILSLLFLLFMPFNKKIKAGRIYITLMTLAIVMNFFELVPFFKFSKHNNTPASNKLSILLSDANMEKNDFTKLGRLINNREPDIVILQGIKQDQAFKLKYLGAAYPYNYNKPRFDKFGLAILSKVKMHNIKLVTVGLYDIPVITFDATIHGKNISILTMQGSPSTHQKYYENRNEMLDTAAVWANSKSNPIIIAGNLNTTMYSENYKKLIKDSKLKSIADITGLYASWTTKIPFLLWIPIDMFLFKGDIKPVDFKTLKNVGSDHYPIMIFFEI